MSESSFPTPASPQMEPARPGNETSSSQRPPPKGSTTEQNLPALGLVYHATADWMILRKKEKPVAEMFYVSYAANLSLEQSSQRPVTFVFNGGPGAASAYLHVGALGPRRIQFAADGSMLPPPARLIDNESTWLSFTDLVFIDPIGTGFSRTIDEEPSKGKDSGPGPVSGRGSGAEPKDNEEFYRLTRDLESLGEFMSRFLSKNHLWSRPVFIAGESYGGFRVGKLARLLQEGYGIGLNGALLISPALELSLLEGSDYDILMWTDVFPSLVATASHHGKSKTFPKNTQLDSVLREAERFATNDLVRVLIAGMGMAETERNAIFTRAADMLGLPYEFVRERSGRISVPAFSRELLRSERKVVGLYDATIVANDPFPDRELYQGADPTLFSTERVFTAGINQQIRETLKVETEREYHLLSLKVNGAWKIDTRKHAFESQVGATDDLRYALTLNPHMKVFITNGLYDLVTPYFASDRLKALMNLAPEQAKQVSVRHFKGGHMFYAWEESRTAFRRAAEDFYVSAISQ